MGEFDSLADLCLCHGHIFDSRAGSQGLWCGFFFLEIFIYFWLCCAVSSAGEWGLLLVAVHRLLAAVPFLLLQNMGSRAQDQ